MASLETSKAKWRARLVQFCTEGVENLARVIAERWFPDPCSQSIKEKALRQTMKCALEGYDIRTEGIVNCQYEKEFRRIGAAFEKAMGENGEALGPPEVLKGVVEGIKGTEHTVVRDAGHIPSAHPPSPTTSLRLAINSPSSHLPASFPSSVISLSLCAVNYSRMFFHLLLLRSYILLSLSPLPSALYSSHLRALWVEDAPPRTPNERRRRIAGYQGSMERRIAYRRGRMSLVTGINQTSRRP